MNFDTFSQNSWFTKRTPIFRDGFFSEGQGYLWLEDAWIVGQAALMTMVLTDLIKITVRRFRPEVYRHRLRVAMFALGIL